MTKEQKFCPLVRQPCVKNQCEFFYDVLGRCQISTLSYNTYRLAESLKDKSVNLKDQTNLTFENRSKPNDSPPGIPF